MQFDFIKNFAKGYNTQLIGTLVILIFNPIIKYSISIIISRYSNFILIKELRGKVIQKYLNGLVNIFSILFLITIWGVTPEWIFASFASIFAIIGIAFFAQWSLLSNITAGIIIYFTVPFKIGDTIKILDKDFPLEAVVEDIKAFHIYLKTNSGELVTFPNNLLLQKGITIMNEP